MPAGMGVGLLESTQIAGEGVRPRGGLYIQAISTAGLGFIIMVMITPGPLLANIQYNLC